MRTYAVQPAVRVSALGALFALAVVLLGIAWAPGAQAHDQLVSSTPADGETLEAAPTEAQLTFSADIEQVGIAFVLTDGSGELLDLPTVPALDGAVVTVALPALEPGSYSLEWRVVSSDGHPISGTIGFTVGEPEPATPTATPTAAAGAADEGRALPLWAIVAIAIGGVAVIGGALVALIGKMRRG